MVYRCDIIGVSPWVESEGKKGKGISVKSILPEGCALKPSP